MDFTRQDIVRSFTKTIAERGLGYFRQGNVLDVLLDENGHFHAHVIGSASEPYQVRIIPIRRSGWVALDSNCTCPYEDQCKHAAAVAYEILAHGYDEVEVDEDQEEEEEEREFILPDPAPPVKLDIPVPSDLVDWFRKIENSLSDEHALAQDVKQRLFYRLKLRPNAWGGYGLVVSLVNRTLLKSGAFGVMTDVKQSSVTNWQKPKHWSRFDVALVADLHANLTAPDYNAAYVLDGRHGERLLREVLTSGSAIWEDGSPMTLGPVRHGTFEWDETTKKGMFTPRIRLEGRGVVLMLSRPWYLSDHACGPIECGIEPELAGVLIRRPPIGPEHLARVRTELERMGVPPAALPSGGDRIVVLAPDPISCLSIDFELCRMSADVWNPPLLTAPVAFAKLTFEYEGVRAPADGSDVKRKVGDEYHVLKRNTIAEERAREALLHWGWGATTYCGWEIPSGRGNSLCIAPASGNRLTAPLEKVQRFAETVLPKLLEAGWKVDLDLQFRYVPETEVEWDVELEDGSGPDWFQFKLGIRVEGEPFDLRPILAQAMRPLPDYAKTEDVFVFGLNGRAIKLSRSRLEALMQPLVELFGGLAEWPKDLRLSKAALPELDRLQERAAEAQVLWKTTEELAQLQNRFRNFDHLEPMVEPDGFKGQLREYQREGLAWLQFLREYGFGGVLADDMGLGKTVQILAHIQTEKAAGRLDRPCLIVAPTSTLPNWRRECERFAPELKIVTLRGGRRAGRFTELPEADVALTTYPLLVRDHEHLEKTGYHLLVLDEAQNIKNPITVAAKAVKALNARHRICLSGTPVENHLGELWSLFQFLMPGFLGTDAEFRRRFRTPIEKGGDREARESLARRIRPFMLRRTKGQVVKELPPKTEIVETIEFEDPQRDLYESIRVAMDKQVRDLIANQGFEKSRIQVLDALLKLRQVCCDPRLVKLASAKKVATSAKLDRLIEMLGVLIEDGRRVLLFSQFTSMLDLIEERLKTEGVRWVRISGDTEDRETPVQRFQMGEVPLFLISLKAGGTGLNLTAADTVILYDPWWNPAVENQAIDRAHRIGQENPVIVYKLVASGTIEEKMLEMQARKGDIARSILDDDAESIRTLTADDLRWILS